MVLSLLQACKETTCVTKCCGPGEELFRSENSLPRCSPKTDSSFLHDMRASYENPDEPPSPPHTVVSHVPTCYPAVELYPSRDVIDKFYLKTDGRLYVESWGQSRTIEQYCLEVNTESTLTPGELCNTTPKWEKDVNKKLNFLNSMMLPWYWTGR